MSGINLVCSATVIAAVATVGAVAVAAVFFPLPFADAYDW